ncbi:MAG: TatD family hydrolase [Burkholderiales bacterium]|nr:TatD family hydrolase [Burkholderiales bacterium]
MTIAAPLQYVDSHCHIDFPDFAEGASAVIERMRAASVTHALCISVNLEDFPRVAAVAAGHEGVFATVGVHPDHEDGEEPDADRLVALAATDKVVGIGETGLDYYRRPDRAPIQQQRFRAHIEAACRVDKPLVIHTRSAADDTLTLMREGGADRCGGVMHCFTETWDVAKAALDLGFHISFSGIVTFRNAAALRDVARQVPEDRLLIETDAPYLAPVPLRGKRNEPAFVPHVAACLAEVRGTSVDAIADRTAQNFFDLFRGAAR